jgi:hypothetical protein
MDVITIFLHGTLDEEIYITQPEGYIKFGTAHQVCRLLKSLYGLNHASRVWYETFDTFLLNQGFLKCTSDPNVYIKRSHNAILLLGLYINHLVIIPDNF